MMQELVNALWALGSFCASVFLFYGVFLVLDFELRASAALERVIARLSLYDSLGRNGLVSNAKYEVLQGRILRP
jgi:hypothetical protein